MNVQKLPGLDWHPDGYAALSGPLLELAEALDVLFLGWARQLGAHAYACPSLIALADLAPIGWLQSFPHLATFATTLTPEALERVAAGQGGTARLDAAAGLEPPGHVLTPAACYHLYPRLAGRELGGEGHFTLVCLCHRRETEYRPLERQWCFRMRELVCLGAEAAVEAFITDCEQRIDRCTRALGLDTRWQSATDPFFDPRRDPKALAQQLEPVKRELVFGQRLAIGSINRHRRFFGECYRIHSDGEPAASACVAFGIERWLFAITRTHGADPADWPRPAQLLA